MEEPRKGRKRRSWDGRAGGYVGSGDVEENLVARPRGRLERLIGTLQTPNRAMTIEYIFGCSSARWVSVWLGSGIEKAEGYCAISSGTKGR